MPTSRGKASAGYVEGLSKEIVTERRAATSVFQNLDGTKTARVYGTPVHYQDSTGAWQDIDTKIIPDLLGGFRNGGGLMAVHFAPIADNAGLVTAAIGGHTVKFSMEGAGPALGLASGSGITYKSVTSTRDLEYHLGTDVLKELVVLRQAPPGGAAASASFLLDPGDLTPRTDTGGGIGLYDSHGTRQMQILRPRCGTQRSTLDPVERPTSRVS